MRLACVSLIGLVGCAAAYEPVAVSSYAIVDGAETLAHPAVVAITFAEDPSAVRCSGTLIGERVVLTAAHCGAHLDPGAFEVTLGSSVPLGGGSPRIGIVEAIAHPEDDGRSAEHDLAVLLLAAAPGIAPMPLLELAPTLSSTARLVGFGQTGPDTSDADRRREGSATIGSIEPTHVVLGPAPSLPCHGDSGGAVLVERSPGGALALAAVISRGDADCSDAARAARVDAHLDDFIGPWLAAWEPGSRRLGERCLDHALCESGLCVEALDEPALRFCGSACETECDAPLSCQEGLCRHPTPSPGALGHACTSDAECASRDCVPDLGMCSMRCVDSCPAGYVCSHLGGIDLYCVPAPAEGCAVGRGSRSGMQWAALLGLLLLWRNRARSKPISKATTGTAPREAGAAARQPHPDAATGGSGSTPASTGAGGTSSVGSSQPIAPLASSRNAVGVDHSLQARPRSR